jgi:hypothetical protein
MKESELQSRVLADLESLGSECECFKIEKANKNGIPDIFFTTRASGPCMIEMKKPGEKPTPLQQHHIDGLIRCGCKAFVCDGWDAWITIKKVLSIGNS